MIKRSNSVNKPLAILIWGIIFLAYAVYFFLIVPEYFSGWQDYVTFLVLFIAIYFTTYRWLWPWIDKHKHKGFWIFILPFVVQLVCIAVLILLISYAAGGLDNDMLVWDILNFWHMIPLPILPILIAFAYYSYHKSVFIWQEKEDLKVMYNYQELVPHLVNNNHSILSGMVSVNPSLAIQFIDVNAKLIGYYLRTHKKIKVRIKEEIEHLNTLEALHTLRKNTKICMIRRVAPALLDSYVPNMMILNLVENSLKYGVVDDAVNPIVIEIKKIGECKISIQVSNAILQHATKIQGTGTGLNRAKEILQWLDPNSSFDVIRTNTYFIVKVTYCISI